MLSVEVKSCCGKERLVTQGTIFSDGVEVPSKERRGKRRRDISEKEETASAMLDRVERHTGVGLGGGCRRGKLAPGGQDGKWKMENQSVEIFDSPIFKLTPCLPSIPTLQTGPSWTSRSVALASCFSRVSSVVSRGFDVEEPRVRV